MRKHSRTSLSIIFLVFSMSLVIFSENTVAQTSTPVFFHASQLRTDLSIFGLSGSERIYERADSNLPGRQSPVTETLSAQIQSSRLAEIGIKFQQNAYVAYVAWLLPLFSDVKVDGDVQINVWMSSADDPGLGSAYFFAIADVNPRNLRDIQVLWYDSVGGVGNLIGSSPKLLSTRDLGRPFRISNHQFAAGRSLAFFTGAGSIRQGWQFSVFFDSQDRNSGAIVPSVLVQTLSTTMLTASTSSASTSVSATSSYTASSGSSSVPPVTYRIPFQGMKLAYYSETTDALMQRTGLSAKGWVTLLFHDLSATAAKMDIGIEGTATQSGQTIPVRVGQIVDFPTDRETLVFLRLGGQRSLTIYAGPSGVAIPSLPGFSVDLTRTWNLQDETVARIQLGSFSTYRYRTTILSVPAPGGGIADLDFFAYYEKTAQVLVYGEIYAAQTGGSALVEKVELRETNVQLPTAPSPTQCVIATAAYGSELAGPVQFLREFRDNDVKSTNIGRAFMEAFDKWYYSWAPSIAQTIQRDIELRSLTRIILLPLIGSLYLSHAAFNILTPLNQEVAVLSAGILASSLIGIVYLTPLACILARSSGRKITLRTLMYLAVFGVAVTFYATLSQGASGVLENLTSVTAVEFVLLAPAALTRKLLG